MFCDEKTDRMKREQKCIDVRHISEASGESNEDPICLIDVVKTIAESQLLANIDTGNDVRLTRQNLCNIIRNKCHHLNLDFSKCIGHGMAGASNVKSETKGAAPLICKDDPMARHFHCMTHCFKLMRTLVYQRCFHQKLYCCCLRNLMILQLQRSKKSHLTGNNQKDYWGQCSFEETV